MKKVLSIIFLLVMVLSLFVGCQSTEPDPNVLSLEPPSLEVRREMRDTIWKLGLTVDLTNYPKYCKQAWYYGTINGCIISFVGNGVMQVESTICVADYAFTYHVPFHIFVYKDGEALQLQEAYEQDWLTKEHIKQIYERHPQVLEEMSQAMQSQ